MTLTTAHARSTAFRFGAGGHETCAPASVAAVMVGVAVLNFMASTWGQTLPWVFSSLVLALNTLILHSQLTAAKSVQVAFRGKAHPESLSHQAHFLGYGADAPTRLSLPELRLP
ncbi:hypothetical protein ACFCWG_41815 [Streptomyces sp. NPDC056390]|uniref:hypothetical protein n=1 Tax=Streptomyces sp. NPDC056390 TaxID=3345806 RepID=UPI0035D7657B